MWGCLPECTDGTCTAGGGRRGPEWKVRFFSINQKWAFYVRQELLPSAPDWMLQKSLIRRRLASFWVKDILASKIFEEALLTETVEELECNFLSPNKSCFQIGQFISFLLLQRTNRVAASVEKLVEKTSLSPFPFFIRFCAILDTESAAAAAAAL